MKAILYPQYSHDLWMLRDDETAAMEAPSNTAAREETPNIPHLPSHVVTEILSRLPIKTVVAAKCVCKSWLNLVSTDTHLARLHRLRSPTTELLLRPAAAATNRRPSAKLYFGNTLFHHNVFYSVKHRPLFDLPRFDITTNNTIIWEKKKMNDLIFVNSSNGLVCFTSFDLGFALIINPITSEFITVPMSTKQGSSEIIPTVNYRLGFSEKENRFKLLRAMYRADSSKQSAEICTFEKGSKWRDIGDCPHPILQSARSESVILEHKLHYDFVCSGEIVNGIAWFDFEKEQFGVEPIPSFLRCPASDSVFGVLRGCLSLSSRPLGKYSYEIWVMKKYGDRYSWENEFTFFYNGCPVPLKQLENGDILMSCKLKCMVACNLRSYQTSFAKGFKYLEVSAYSPTLLRLKDALAGYEACIHDVNSRRRNLRPSHPEDQNTLQKLNKRTKKRRLKP